MIQWVSAQLAAGPAEIGGKAHGLARMVRLGLPVPPALVIGTDFTERWGHGPDHDHELSRALAELGAERVSVRSGAAVSMPGMLDTVLDLDPQDPDLIAGAIGEVIRSWDSLRARTYRRVHQIPDRPGTAVVVQAMVRGDRDHRSLTGVAFSRDPLTGGPGPVGEILRHATGPDLVSGRRTPEPLSVCAALVPEAFAGLAAAVAAIERDLQQSCEIEFTVESGVLWLLQCRAVTPGPTVAPAVAVGLAESGVITRAEAVQRVPAGSAPRPAGLLDDTNSRLGRGIGAAPGVVSGRIATHAAAAARWAADGPVILVRPETSPSDLPAMTIAAGLLTARGGLASHAAVVARASGLPTVVGLTGLEVVDGTCRFGDRVLSDGDWISIDGTSGLVLRGMAGSVSGADDPAVATLRSWAATESR